MSPAYTRFPRGTIQFPSRDKAKEDSVTSKNFPTSRPCSTYCIYLYIYVNAHEGTYHHRRNRYIPIVCIECPSISLKFRWIVCPRPPLATHTRARARVHVITRIPIHAPGSLRMCGWRAHTGGKERERSRVEEEES